MSPLRVVSNDFGVIEAGETDFLQEIREPTLTMFKVANLIVYPTENISHYLLSKHAYCSYSPRSKIAWRK